MSLPANNPPLVSFIVPVYNTETLLERCIQSLIGQTLSEIEIILIDDGSTDNSQQICHSYAKQDKRISYYHLSHIGVSGVRNFGLNKAKGEYIGFVDNDDYLDPEFAHEMYSSAKENSSIFACCGVRKIFAASQHEDIYIPKPAIYDAFLRQNPNVRNPIWNKIFKREYINMFMLKFPADTFFAEDYAFVFMYYAACKNLGPISIVKQPLYCYWRHQTSIMSNLHLNLSKKIHNSMKNVKAISCFYQQHSLAQYEQAIFDQVAVRYFLIILPMLLLHNSMLQHKFNRNSLIHIFKVYNYYQHKYQALVPSGSKLARFRFKVMVSTTRLYAPLWRWVRGQITKKSSYLSC